MHIDSKTTKRKKITAVDRGNNSPLIGLEAPCMDLIFLLSSTCQRSTAIGTLLSSAHGVRNSFPRVMKLRRQRKAENKIFAYLAKLIGSTLERDI
jgi:hypothetical protein